MGKIQVIMYQQLIYYFGLHDVDMDAHILYCIFIWQQWSAANMQMNYISVYSMMW